MEFEGWIQLCWVYENKNVTKLQEERTVRECMHWLITPVWLLQVFLPVMAPQYVALQVYSA